MLKFLLLLVVSIPLQLRADPVGDVSNDGEIATVLMTIDDGEVDAAKMEMKTGRNPSVRDFAKAMIDQHRSNMTETKALAKSNSLDAKTSDLSKSIKTDAKSLNGDLAKATRADFDKAYLDEQIKMHTEALNVIDQKLVAKVSNPNLREHLNKTRSAVESHIRQAKELRAKM